MVQVNTLRQYVTKLNCIFPNKANKECLLYSAPYFSILGMLSVTFVIVLIFLVCGLVPTTVNLSPQFPVQTHYLDAGNGELIGSCFG